jgi:hypothetical protein
MGLLAEVPDVPEDDFVELEQPAKAATTNVAPTNPAANSRLNTAPSRRRHGRTVYTLPPTPTTCEEPLTLVRNRIRGRYLLDSRVNAAPPADREAQPTL